MKWAMGIEVCACHEVGVYHRG